MAYSYLLYRPSNKPWCGSFFHTSNPITFSFSCPFIFMDCSMMPFFCLHAREGCCLKSRPSRGSTVRPFYDTITKRFLLTRPSRGATFSGSSSTVGVAFLLTRPSRGATLCRWRSKVPPSFLLTRPSRGATTYLIGGFFQEMISTHTPLAGRDVCVRLPVAGL